MEEILQQTIALVKEAGKEVMKVYARDFTVQEKQDRSPVTQADLASEKIILQGLRTAGFGILSEETKAEDLWFKKDKVWVVDPLDGTLDFIQKGDDFSIMIGLVEKRQPVLGIVYQPSKDKLYFAQQGKGAFVQESGGEQRKLQVSDISDFAYAGVILSRNHTTPEQKEFARKVGFGKVEHVGSVGVKMGVIAEGKAEAYFTESDKTHQWDTAAGEIILKEAGGIVTSLRGEPLVYCSQQTTNHPQGLVACNKALYSQLLRAIKYYFKLS